jgi:phage terminase large subunit GpA-like protein
MGSVLNKTPSGKALKMGMRLVHLDTDKLKDMFYERMGKALSGEAGGAWLHRDVQLDYARQITAEEKRLNEKGIETWEPISKGRDNHYLDAEVIAGALADWEWPGGGVNLLPDPADKKPEAKPAASAAWSSDENSRKKPGWFNRR